MPIKRLANGKYRIDISVGFDPITGKRRRKTKTAKTKKEAETIYYSLKEKYKNKSSSSERNLSFSQIRDIYLENCKFHNKPNYYAIQEYTISKHIFPTFEKCNFKKTTHTEIKDFQMKLINSGLDPKTINNIMIILNKLFETAILENVIKINPCTNVKNLPLSKKQMKFWTPDQFKTFIHLIDTEEEFIFKVFYTTSYLTGMRCGEMLALDWTDLDKFRKEINVHKSLSFNKGEYKITTPKTKNSIRRVSVNSKLIDLLDQWKEKQREIFHKLNIKHSDKTFMFGYRELPPSKDRFSRGIRRICSRGSLEPIRLHDLRHSHVALLIHQGEDYATIKERLGHASIKTTIDVYGHLFPNKQREIADRLDDLL
ncbi:tyrosine-type recombinase/integrase [Bacillus swezeyi]|uniref:tyrosine-type recombinase/integrase n=1 Tax=Bacillus swezeyi TaxID=1925020 RepID=UPI0039C6151F